MDVLTENKENFGSMSVFMRKWWADNFVLGVGSNTSVSTNNVGEQASGFTNAINLWINTLYNYVVNNLDAHPALQEWYSSILNNYFTKLLSNAQDFANKQSSSFKTAMGGLIARGK
jgi:hypothetical protein